MDDRSDDIRFDALRLMLLGFLTLFVELALIRYLAAGVWNLGYFPNFVLISAYVGLGIGFVFHGLLSARRSQRAYLGAAVMLLVIVVVVTKFRPRVPGIGQEGGQLGGELFFSANESTGATALYVFPVLFVLIATVFAFIAQRTAKVFARFRPLTAYTLDIAGSCLGIVSFMLVSQFQAPGWMWFIVMAALFLLAAPRLIRIENAFMVAALAGCAFLAWEQDQQLLFATKPTTPVQVIWSPYQKIEVIRGADQQTAFLFVNGILHQTMQPRAKLVEDFYQVPHQLRREGGRKPYSRVLIVGAGSGNDVAAALRNGAEHVDAIEIDPVIARLGRKYHPMLPYDDPRVTVVVDDGRAFLGRAKGPYDLIIFALTDSLVKISPVAQLRLENYLFTEESVRRAYNLLADDGELVFYNWYREDWLVEKIKRMIEAATGAPPTSEFRFNTIAGLVVRRSAASGAQPVAAKPEIAAAAAEPRATAEPWATDDWPFLYLRQKAISPVYQGVMAGVVVVVAALLAALRVLERRAGAPPIDAAGVLLRAAFLLMGAAFLLLETKGVIQYSLLFGTTWQNSSLVFLAVLVSVLVANWAATAIRGAKALPLLFALLLASCLVTLVWPLASLLSIEDARLRFVLASLMTFSPIFFANLIFSISFRDQPSAERLFGWNLLGATLGGVLEYASMILGYNALAILVAVLYALVMVALLASRRMQAATV